MNAPRCRTCEAFGVETEATTTAPACYATPDGALYREADRPEEDFPACEECRRVAMAYREGPGFRDTVDGLVDDRGPR